MLKQFECIHNSWLMFKNYFESLKWLAKSAPPPPLFGKGLSYISENLGATAVDPVDTSLVID